MRTHFSTSTRLSWLMRNWPVNLSPTVTSSTAASSCSRLIMRLPPCNAQRHRFIQMSCSVHGTELERPWSASVSPRRGEVFQKLLHRALIAIIVLPRIAIVWVSTEMQLIRSCQHVRHIHEWLRQQRNDTRARPSCC